jgi:hypothetical protein
MRFVADLFRMTSPLMIRLACGRKRVMAEHFPHPRGLLYFDLYWHLQDPAQAVHVVPGPIRGEGPWKVGEALVQVLGCQGSDPELAAAFEAWRNYLALHAADYPPRPLIQAIARRYAAAIDPPA